MYSAEKTLLGALEYRGIPTDGLDEMLVEAYRTRGRKLSAMLAEVSHSEEQKARDRLQAALREQPADPAKIAKAAGVLSELAERTKKRVKLQREINADAEEVRIGFVKAARERLGEEIRKIALEMDALMAEQPASLLQFPQALPEGILELHGCAVWLEEQILHAVPLTDSRGKTYIRPKSILDYVRPEFRDAIRRRVAIGRGMKAPAGHVSIPNPVAV